MTGGGRGVVGLLVQSKVTLSDPFGVNPVVKPHPCSFNGLDPRDC